MYGLAETNPMAKIGKKKYTDTKVSDFFNKKAHFPYNSLFLQH